jgi:hypothetical protein
MLLAEELVLLLVPRATGAAPTRPGIHSALAATVLVELADGDGLDYEDGWLTVCPGAAHPMASALADGTVDDLMQALAPGLYRATLDRLTAEGLLTRHPGWRGARWRLADSHRRDHLHAELAVVLLDDLPADARTGPLIMLLTALGVVDTVFAGLTPAGRQRAGLIARAGWARSDVTAAIAKATRDRVEYPPAS